MGYQLDEISHRINIFKFVRKPKRKTSVGSASNTYIIVTSKTEQSILTIK